MANYQAKIIQLNVRWYLGYALNYRDLEEMMTERRLSIDHTVIFRWMQDHALKLTNEVVRI